MGDLTLFHITSQEATQLQGSQSPLEKSLQMLMEKHLAVLFGVRLLGTEYSTGKKHGGRIDTIGVDENGSPVIIEYKRSMNENVINQGLFYLDWLLDHKAEFEALLHKVMPPGTAPVVDWQNPRLVCVAGDFTRYDEHAINQIDRSIELFRYRQYAGDLLALELVASTAAKATAAGLSTGKTAGGTPSSKTVTQYYEQAPTHLKALYDDLEAALLGLGDDVSKKATQLYFAFRRVKNFACVEVHPQSQALLVFLKVDPDSIALEENFSRNVREIGHFGTGDLELKLKTGADLDKALPLLAASYELS